MKPKKLISTFIIVAICFGIAHFIYKKIANSEIKLPFKYSQPIQKNISQQIYSSGILRIKDHIKVGSLVGGVIKEIYVNENDKVSKGQLLAKIDNGKEDTDVKIAKGRLLKAQSDIEYLQKYFNRQKQLFKSKQISQDFFDKVTRDFNNAKAELQITQADLEKKEIEYKNTQIKAPESGTIISVGITKGERVTTDLDATVLFKIAKDLTSMEAKLDIDESDIGQIKKDLKIKFKVDTYPEKKFYGKITNVSFSPKKKHNIQTYEAIASVSNKQERLRPGMTVNAKLTTNKKKSCLTVPNQVFQINPESLKQIAQNIDFSVIPISPKEKKHIKKSHDKMTAIKFVWCKKDKCFLEKTVEIGITDDSHYEVICGLDMNDKVIVDIEEPNEMDKVYKSWFGKGL